MPEFGLINMNGRVYDPLIRRFLSPDPAVTYPDNPLSYNKYAYAMNNPLKYTDPNGENPLLIAMGIGALINIAMNYKSIHSLKDAFAFGFVGAISGALTYISGGAVSGFLPGLAVGVVFNAGIVAGTSALNAGLNGGDPLQAAKTGAVIGGILGGIQGGIRGYNLANKIPGANPWTGKVSQGYKPKLGAKPTLTGATTRYFGKPISDLPWKDEWFIVKSDLSSFGYEVLVKSTQFTAFDYLPEILPRIIGQNACNYACASYISILERKMKSPADYKLQYQGIKDPGDHSISDKDFFNKYFDSKQMEKSTSFSKFKEYGYGGRRVTILDVSDNSIDHAVVPVGFTEQHVVFFDPSYGGYRYMPYNRTANSTGWHYHEIRNYLFMKSKGF